MSIEPIPTKIWIQQSEDPLIEGFEVNEYVTWCTRQVDTFDIEYVLCEILDDEKAKNYSLEKENERLKQNWQELREWLETSIKVYFEYGNKTSAWLKAVYAKMAEIEEREK